MITVKCDFCKKTINLSDAIEDAWMGDKPIGWICQHCHDISEQIYSESDYHRELFESELAEMEGPDLC